MWWDDDEYFRFENMLNINAFQASAISFGNNFQASGGGTPGPKGDKGDTGEQGLPGKDGTDGQDGKSAYQIAVDNGFTGTEQEWLDSLRGANGTNGADGNNGKSAYEVAVDNGFSGTEQEWLDSIKGKDGKDGAPGLTPRVYHMDLSKVTNSIDIILDGIRAKYSYNDANSIKMEIHSASANNVTIDLKRSSQYDAATVEGSTLDNYTLTPSNYTVDAIIYNSSREMHRTWIRTKDPTTGLWSLFQIDLFVSKGGVRTDIIVYEIYRSQQIDYFDR